MHTIFIYECSPGRLTLSFVKSDYVRDNGREGRGQDTHQRIAAEKEKFATNGAFFMFGGWAWRS